MYTRIDKEAKEKEKEIYRRRLLHVTCDLMDILKVGGADHDGALVGEGVDGVLAVVAAHARVADSTEGERVVYWR
jgi:hypothetical protein